MTAKTNLATPSFNSSTWNTPLNSNFTILNDALGSTESVSISAADVTLTATQAQKMRIALSGTLTGNRTLFFPSATSGFWIVTNGTTGSYSITVKNAAGSVGAAVSQGYSAFIYSDGTNVYLADDSATVGIVPAGTLIEFGGTSAPSGYLACDGTEYSRTTYARLFAAIGTTWGAGNGSTTFNVPDLRGYFLRGAGTNSDGTVGPAVGEKQADTYLNHTHGVTENPHTHTVAVTSGNSPSSVFGTGAQYSGGSTTTSSVKTNLTVNASTTGGTETRPKNFGVLHCIKW